MKKGKKYTALLKKLPLLSCDEHLEILKLVLNQIVDESSKTVRLQLGEGGPVVNVERKTMEEVEKYVDYCMEKDAHIRIMEKKMKEMEDLLSPASGTDSDNSDDTEVEEFTIMRMTQLVKGINKLGKKEHMEILKIMLAEGNKLGLSREGNIGLLLNNVPASILHNVEKYMKYATDDDNIIQKRDELMRETAASLEEQFVSKHKIRIMESEPDIITPSITEKKIGLKKGKKNYNSIANKLLKTAD